MKQYLVITSGDLCYQIKAFQYSLRQSYLIFEDFDEDCEPYEVAAFANWTAVIEMNALTFAGENEKVAD